MSRQYNTLTSFLLGLLGTTVVLAIGLFVFRHFTNDTTTYGQITADATVVESPDTVSSRRPAKVETVSEHSFEDLDQISSDYIRAVALRSMLATADEFRVLELIEQSSGLPNKERRVFTQGQLFRRYAALDPANALRHASEIPLNERGTIVRAVFREWVVADPNEAIQQAKTLDNLHQRIALESILRFKEALDYDQFTDISQELGHTDVGDTLLEGFAIAKSVDDPKEALVAVLNDSIPEAYQYTTIAAIVENWFDRDGESALFQFGALAQDFAIQLPIPPQPFKN